MLPLLAAAQKNAFERFYDSYSGKEGYTTVFVTGDMIKLIRKDLSGGTGGIESVRVVTQQPPTDDFVERVKGILEAENYKLMSSVSSGPKQISVYMRETSSGKGRRSDCITLISGGKDNVVMNIVGDFDITKLSDLGIKTE